MKGLTGVLGRFSKGLRERKILGALLEEVCDNLSITRNINNLLRIR